MSGYTWAIKDVAEVKDYGVDWTDTLATEEQIASATFTVISGGVTIASQFVAGNVATAFVSGGTVGTAKIACTIVTNSSPARTFRQVVSLPIVNRAS